MDRCLTAAYTCNKVQSNLDIHSFWSALIGYNLSTKDVSDHVFYNLELYQSAVDTYVGVLGPHGSNRQWLNYVKGIE